MKYMGSKKRHVSEILPIILRERTPDQYYIEPFVGGFNVIESVTGPRIANDNNHYLIALFQALQQGWLPPTVVTYEEYTAIRCNKLRYPPHLVGFVGFGCSYAGKWFGGYARGEGNKGNPRNYCAESRSNVLKQAPKLNGLQITCMDYQHLVMPPRSLIYCDPPYANSTRYVGTGLFDTPNFWTWVRKQSTEGHTVFVSEYEAPTDFECVWEKPCYNTLVADTGEKVGLERLYVMKGTT